MFPVLWKVECEEDVSAFVGLYRSALWNSRYTAFGKKVSPKVVSYVLSNPSEVLHEISNVYY